MDYGGYLAIGLMALAGVFFVLAILRLRSGRVQALKFTYYGLVALAVVSFMVMTVTGSPDSKISFFVFVLFAAVYRWFYRGILRDEARK